MAAISGKYTYNMIVAMNEGYPTEQTLMRVSCSHGTTWYSLFKSVQRKLAGFAYGERGRTLMCWIVSEALAASPWILGPAIATDQVHKEIGLIQLLGVANGIDALVSG
jgi:hypothetical protein